MNAEIITVGTELLLGDVINTDSAIVARALKEIGIGVLYMSTVGDNPERLEDAVNTAINRSDLVITTGGLGPTDDDLTKETIARCCAKKLVLDEESRKRIEEFFKGRQCSDNQIKQAMLPENCYVLPNDCGTAPGCVTAAENGTLVAMLPGPPSELTAMVNNYLVPYLNKDNQDVIISKNIRVFGRGEGTVAHMLREQMKSSNPTVAPYAGKAEMYVRVTAKAETEKAAENLINPMVDEIKSIIGDYVYSTEYDTLEETVFHLLLEQNKTISTAESCTGGMVAKRITDLAGSSAVFEMGAVTYSNRIKTQLINVPSDMLAEFGAVSPQVAKAMCEGVLEEAGADIGVGITGIAGPGGGTDTKPVGLVYVGVTDGINTYVKKLGPQGKNRSRDFYRTRSASVALDMVRRLLTGLPVIDDTI